jgi:hypothetical protein
MQQGMGMVGLFIIHPKVAHDPPVDRDFGFIIQEWAILPGSSVHNTMSMEFNLFTLNGRAAPYITPMIVRQGERVRIRFFNFSAIDHHPMHLHGLTFWITGTEAGRIPETAWIPSNNVLVAVAQARDVEFIANNPGDWVFHCHMFHHMMNFMSSLVGPMGGHTVGRGGLQAGGDMATAMGMIGQGPALSEAFGPRLGRGTGELTGSDRAVGSGRGGPNSMQSEAHQFGANTGQRMDSGQEHGQHSGDEPKVPGFPQSMAGMSMYSEKEIEKLNSSPPTRGLRKGWYGGVEGLMTMVRVLPSDLYDRVVSGEKVPPGASVPGAMPGKEPDKHKNH